MKIVESRITWAADELRSANAQIEFLLRRALRQSGRLPSGVAADASALPTRGRPPKDPHPSPDEGGAHDTDTEE